MLEFGFRPLHGLPTAFLNDIYYYNGSPLKNQSETNTFRFLCCGVLPDNDL